MFLVIIREYFLDGRGDEDGRFLHGLTKAFHHVLLQGGE